MRFLLNLIIICLSILIIYAFFLPWVTGKGSLAKPVEDATKPIQKADVTRVSEGAVKIGKGIVDTFTQAVVPIRLKQTLAGYQIPLSDNKDIKKLGKKIYLLYALPIAALFCVYLSIKGNRNRFFDFLAFLLALVVFLLIYFQVDAFNNEGLFVKIQACRGFWLTLFAFLIITFLLFMKLFYPTKQR